MSYRFTMSDEEQSRGAAPDEAAVAAAQAIYTPFMLSFYDRLVHGFSNRFAWRCPTERILGLYRDNLSQRHLEAGVVQADFRSVLHGGSFQAAFSLSSEPGAHL